MAAPTSSLGEQAVPLIINGREVRPDATFDVLGPRTGEVIHKCSNADVTHAQDAIAAGAEAFKSWSQTTPSHRRDILLKAARILEERTPELRKYMMDETGSDEGWADFNLFVSKECLLDCAGRISGIEGRIAAPMDPTTGALIVKEPYGVILAMSPWYVFQPRERESTLRTAVYQSNTHPSLGMPRTSSASEPSSGPLPRGTRPSSRVPS